MRNTIYTLAGATALGLLVMAPAFAEDAHHPGGGTAPATSAPAPQTQAQLAPGMPMGGNSGGMMMCPMMGGQGGMMGMMGGLGMASHIDGHVAFIKAELKVTPAQEAAWTAFADALRISAANMAKMQGMPMGGSGAAVSVAQSLEQNERVLATRLENTKRLHAAWSKLDATLTPEQRKAADQVVAPHLTMM